MSTPFRPPSVADGATPCDDDELSEEHFFDGEFFDDEDSLDDDTWEEAAHEAERRRRLATPVELPEELLEAFATSGEMQALGGVPIDAARIVLRLAAQEYDLDLGKLRWYDLREVVFDSIPYAQPFAPSDAPRFVDETIAFIRFLMRIGTPPHAEELLRVFDRYAAEDLADHIAEPDVLHTPRAALERGRAAGFHVDTPEGLAAWRRLVRDGPPRPKPSFSALRRMRRALAPPTPPPSIPGLFDPVSVPERGDLRKRRATDRLRKKKRKAAGRARRRNRR